LRTSSWRFSASGYGTETPIRCISLFSGGGFAEEALRLASLATGVPVEVVMAVDSWEPAARVRDANLSGVRTTIADVKALRREDLPPHDLVIGGPPCQDHSLAGLRACRCDRGEPPAPRCCLADFGRLRGDAWLMENVRPRLTRDGWSEQFCASDFGDVTRRKRWFYSSHVLHVVPTPGPRRIRDIRDFDEDARVLKKRGCWSGEEMGAVIEDDSVFSTFCATDWHGTKNNGSGKPTKGSKIRCKAGHHGHYDDTLQAHSWHGHDIRGSGKLLPIAVRTGPTGNDARALADDGFAPSLTGLEGCRNPSLLEMARAHSIPDSWDWAGTTKAQRGQIIANSWPLGMGTAICAAMLRALR
jgi:site-specific DNA-cytosine methylase